MRKTLFFLLILSALSMRAQYFLSGSNNQSSVSTPPTYRMVRAINSGGGIVTADSIDFEADTDFTAGSTSSTSQAIDGTTEDDIYQTERWGSFGYDLDLPNGDYLVELHFAEIFHANGGGGTPGLSGPGVGRIFDVLIEGVTVIDDLDINDSTGNLNPEALIFQFEQTLTDGNLDIDFNLENLNPKISGIVIYEEAVGNALVAHYPFDGNVNDIVGGNNGTINGDVGYTDGATANTGQSADFDGDNDWVDVPASQDFDNTSFTMATWVRFDAIPGGFVALLEHDRNGGSWYALFKSSSGAFFRFRWTNAQDFSTTLSTDTWYHVAVSYDADVDSAKMYINGVIDTKVENTNGPDGTHGPFRMGANQAASEDFNGRLDDVRIYNYALEESDVLALYNSYNEEIPITYTPIPTYTPPAGATVQNFSGTGSQISEGDLSGQNNVTITEDWAGQLQPFRLDRNTYDQPIKIYGNGYKIGSDTELSGNISIVGHNGDEPNDTDVIEYYDMEIRGDSDNTQGDFIRGTQGAATSTGTWIRFEKAYALDLSGGSFNINDAPTTVTDEYFERIDFNYCVAHGYGFNGFEGWYIGKTAKTDNSYPMIRNARLTHTASINRDREGYQFNSVVPADDTDYGLWIQNATAYGTARDFEDPHIYSLQVQNVQGLIENSIFDKSPSVAIIAAHDLRFRNVFFNYDGTDFDGPTINADPQIRIQSLSANYGSNAESLNNEPIVFDSVYFKIPNGGNYTTESPIYIAEDETDIIFNRPIFMVDSAAITNTGTLLLDGIIEDGRTDKVTYSITINNPIVVGYDSIPEPTYASYTTDTTSMPFTQEFIDSVGVVTSRWHWEQGLGYRNPNTFIEGEVEFVVSDTTDTSITTQLWSNDTTGTVYVVYTTSGTLPSIAQVKAGQDHTGTAAAYSETVTDFDDPTTQVVATGLNGGTLYYTYAVNTTTTDSRVWKSDTIRTTGLIPVKQDTLDALIAYSAIDQGWTMAASSGGVSGTTSDQDWLTPTTSGDVQGIKGFGQNQWNIPNLRIEAYEAPDEIDVWYQNQLSEDYAQVVDRGDLDVYLRIRNGGEMRYATQPGSISPTVNDPYDLIGVTRLYPNPNNETDGAWKYVDITSNYESAIGGPLTFNVTAGLPTLMHRFHWRVRVDASNNYEAWFGDLTGTPDATGNGATGSFSEFWFGSNGHPAETHHWFRGFNFESGGYTDAEAEQIEAWLDYLWPEGAPTYPHYIDGANDVVYNGTTNVFSVNDATGFAGGSGVEGTPTYQWYYNFDSQMGNNLDWHYPVNSAEGGTNATLDRDDMTTIYEWSGQDKGSSAKGSNIELIRVTTPFDDLGAKGEEQVSEVFINNTDSEVVATNSINSEAATSITATGATAEITTPRTGTWYIVVSTDNTVPIVNEMTRQVDGDGNAPAFATSVVVGSTGAQTQAITGLSASTSYWLYQMVIDGSGYPSLITSTNFTTSAAYSGDHNIIVNFHLSGALDVDEYNGAKYNNLGAHNSTLNDLVDTANVNTGVSITTTGWVGSGNFVGTNGDAFDHPANLWRSRHTMQNAPATITFSGLDQGKTYDVELMSNTGGGGDVDWSVEGGSATTIGQVKAVNVLDTNVSPSSGSITINGTTPTGGSLFGAWGVRIYEHVP